MNQNHISAKDAFEKASDIFTLINTFAKNGKLQISSHDITNLESISIPHFAELKQLGYHISGSPTSGYFVISWDKYRTQKQKAYLTN